MQADVRELTTFSSSAESVRKERGYLAVLLAGYVGCYVKVSIIDRGSMSLILIRQWTMA